MADNIEFKCPNCGGGLVFDIRSQNVTCEYCGGSFSVSDVKSYNQILSEEKNEKMDWGEADASAFSQDELNSLNVYHCDSCGGELIVDENTSATSCPYCDSPVMLTGRLQGGLKPDYVIPFKCTKDDLMPTFEKFLKKKLFLPRVFKSQHVVEEIKGLYVPYWIHDASARGKVRFKGEIVRRWEDSEYRYKEVKYYSIIRGGNISFEHIPVDGSKNLADDLMESIEPFNFKEAVKFEPIYLSGHIADKYDVDKEAVFPRATQRVKDGTVEQFRTTISGYDTVNVEGTNLELYNTKVSYALYPIWIMTTRYQNKLYTFAMNGQTNKIVGNLPMSKGKYALFFSIFFVAVYAILGLIFFLTTREEWYNLLATFLGPLLFCWIPGLIFCQTQAKKLRPVSYAHGAKDYYCKGSMNITSRSDTFVGSKVTKERKPKN